MVPSEKPVSSGSTPTIVSPVNTYQPFLIIVSVAVVEELASNYRPPHRYTTLLHHTHQFIIMITFHFPTKFFVLHCATLQCVALSLTTNHTHQAKSNEMKKSLLPTNRQTHNTLSVNKIQQQQQQKANYHFSHFSPHTTIHKQ